MKCVIAITLLYVSWLRIMHALGDALVRLHFFGANFAAVASLCGVNSEADRASCSLSLSLFQISKYFNFHLYCNKSTTWFLSLHFAMHTILLRVLFEITRIFSLQAVTVNCRHILLFLLLVLLFNVLKVTFLHEYSHLYIVHLRCLHIWMECDL